MNKQFLVIFLSAFVSIGLNAMIWEDQMVWDREEGAHLRSLTSENYLEKKSVEKKNEERVEVMVFDKSSGKDLFKPVEFTKPAVQKSLRDILSDEYDAVLQIIKKAHNAAGLLDCDKEAWIFEYLAYPIDAIPHLSKNNLYKMIEEDETIKPIVLDFIAVVRQVIQSIVAGEADILSLERILFEKYSETDDKIHRIIRNEAVCNFVASVLCGVGPMIRKGSF